MLKDVVYSVAGVNEPPESLIGELERCIELIEEALEPTTLTLRVGVASEPTIAVSAIGRDQATASTETQVSLFVGFEFQAATRQRPFWILSTIRTVPNWNAAPSRRRVAVAEL